jgi:hypothetical protein
MPLLVGVTNLRWGVKGGFIFVESEPLPPVVHARSNQLSLKFVPMGLIATDQVKAVIAVEAADDAGKAGFEEVGQKVVGDLTVDGQRPTQVLPAGDEQPPAAAQKAGKFPLRDGVFQSPLVHPKASRVRCQPNNGSLRMQTGRL